MGVTFEGKIRIVRSLPNPPEFQDQAILGYFAGFGPLYESFIGHFHV